MINQILKVFLWTCLAHLMCCSASTEIPKECAFGTPSYNETLCNETCTKSANVNESFCLNFTQPSGDVQNPLQQQEAGGPVALSGIMTSTAREGIHIDLSTPKIDLNFANSSAITLNAPFRGSSVAIFSVFLFACFEFFN